MRTYTHTHSHTHMLSETPGFVKICFSCSAPPTTRGPLFVSVRGHILRMEWFLSSKGVPLTPSLIMRDWLSIIIANLREDVTLKPPSRPTQDVTCGQPSW